MNSDKGNLLGELVKSIAECQQFYFSVAFINFSGLQLLLNSLKEAKKRGIKGRIITSAYLNFTDAKALEKIREFKNVGLKAFVTDKKLAFIRRHTYLSTKTATKSLLALPILLKVR